jgi:hypothetical protein
MSMNLNATVDGEDLDLWQTPTQITNMICVNHDGQIVELTGKEAKRALQSYCRWVEGSMNGVWDADKLKERMKEVREHVGYIQSLIKSGKRFRVWEM